MTPERFLIRRRDRRRGEGYNPTQLRRLAAVALLTVLGGALVLTRCASPSPSTAAPARGVSAGALTVTTVRPADTTALRRIVPDADHCSDVPGAVAELRCWIDNVSVQYRLLGAVAAASMYRSKAGVAAPAEYSGPAACAHGAAEERAWSRPTAPTQTVGRYRCVLVSGRAEMWWTNQADGVLGHAVALDGDLGALFAWWRARPEA
jgi:hypothetical protein